MLTTEENDLLCRVEGDAPMGRLMRRHWIPAALSEQLGEADGAPVRLRLLGEDLVAFRDTQGRLGVLGESCPHRRSSRHSHRRSGNRLHRRLTRRRRRYDQPRGSGHRNGSHRQLL